MTNKIVLAVKAGKKRFDHCQVGEAFFHKGKFWTRTGRYGAKTLDCAETFSIGVTGGGLMVQAVEGTVA